MSHSSCCSQRPPGRVASKVGFGGLNRQVESRGGPAHRSRRSRGGRHPGATRRGADRAGRADISICGRFRVKAHLGTLPVHNFPAWYSGGHCYAANAEYVWTLERPARARPWWDGAQCSESCVSANTLAYMTGALEVDRLPRSEPTLQPGRVRWKYQKPCAEPRHRSKQARGQDKSPLSRLLYGCAVRTVLICRDRLLNTWPTLNRRETSICGTLSFVHRYLHLRFAKFAQKYKGKHG